jgi:hypothetical protein
MGEEDQVPPVTAERPKRQRKPKISNSRPARWGRAVAEAQSAFADLDVVFGRIEEAFQELSSIKSEYEEWQGNLPDNLQSGALADKLQEVVDLDFDQDPRDMSASDIEELIDNAESVELPLGFGRD